jgi:hypothetical protein
VLIPLSDRVPGGASGPSRSRVNDSGGFSCRGEYIGGRAMSGGGPGAHTIAWRGLGVARAMAWCGRPLAALRLCFGLRLVLGKIGAAAFVLSNFENISYVTFLKHKNNRKQETGIMASC